MAKRTLLEHGVYLEGLGGDIPYAPVSSKSGEGVPELLDLVLLAADIIEPSADPEAPAEGFVLESSMGAKKGASATLIVREGSLKVGDFVVAGGAFAPVRYIEDFRGTRAKEAGPSEPAVIAGFSALPSAGEPFSTARNKKEAEAKAAEAAKAAATRKVALPEGVAALPLIIKADAQGSIDAIEHELAKITHERAAIAILDAGVGDVSEKDVKTAAAAGGSVISFHVGQDVQARELALRDSVAIESFTIIYELAEKVRELLAARAPKVEEERELGRAKVLKTFSSGSKRQVLGARLLSGRLALGDRVKLLRAGTEAARASVANLQQARADVREIAGEGAEFGAELEAKEDAKPGDELVAFEVVES
jgi:translation initiation factor IF-2